MRHIRGSGLLIPYGFSRCAETGYVIPETHQGCQTIWPGYFRDNWIYAASCSGHDTVFGPYFAFIPPLGADATITTGGGGFGQVSSTNRATAYVRCASVPVMPNQYCQMAWAGSDFAFNTDSGGPGVFIKENPSAGIGYWGYGVRLYNKQTFDHSVDSFPRLQLVKFEQVGASYFESALGTYAFTYDTGVDVNGPMQVGHGIRIEGLTEGSDIRLKVYLDDVLRINYLDNSSPFTSGNPGFITGGNVILSGFLCGPV